MTLSPWERSGNVRLFHIPRQSIWISVSFMTTAPPGRQTTRAPSVALPDRFRQRQVRQPATPAAPARDRCGGPIRTAPRAAPCRDGRIALAAGRRTLRAARRDPTMGPQRQAGSRAARAYGREHWVLDRGRSDRGTARRGRIVPSAIRARDPRRKCSSQPATLVRTAYAGFVREGLPYPEANRRA